MRLVNGNHGVGFDTADEVAVLCASFTDKPSNPWPGFPRLRAIAFVSRTPFPSAGKLSLHCIDEQPAAGAAARETLLFIHSLGSDADLWETVSNAFATSYRRIRYDLRGHGRSEIGPPECLVDDHAADLERLLDQLGVPTATLVGVSIGGLIAMAVAVRSPSRVRRLVLCATGAKLGTTDGWNTRIERVRSLGLEGCAEAILDRWFAPGFSERDPRTFRRSRNKLLRTPAAGYLASCVALREADFRRRLSGLRMPALVLSGEHDLIAPPSLGRALAGEIPGATHETILGTAHLPPIEEPAATTLAIQRFLRATP